jgi:hypothetical protein
VVSAVVVTIAAVVVEAISTADPAVSSNGAIKSFR